MKEKFKTVILNGKEYKLKLTTKTAIDDINYYCIVNCENNKVVSKYKLLRNAKFRFDYFQQYPLLPL